jgi:hypothetical protein
MQNSEDIVAITQLVVRERESRDLGFWNRMLDCFHPDAVVNISWFQGLAPDFVAGSKDMAARGMLAKHRLGPVLVTQNGLRALASLAAIIDIPVVLEGRDFTLSAHCLMLYRAEQRHEVWRLASFEAIYRRDEFTPSVLGQSVTLPEEALAGYRPSYRNLCYSLHLKGYTPDNDLPGEDRPETVREIFSKLYHWVGLPVPN